MKKEIKQNKCEYKFLEEFDDNDICFEAGAKNKEGRFISIYTMDSDFTRSLLTKSGIDPFEGHEAELGEYAETYAIDFYAEYYPYTDKVALRYVLDIYDSSICDAINQITFDNTKDDYVILTPELEEDLRHSIKEYAREEIDEFMQYELKNKEDEYVMTPMQERLTEDLTDFWMDGFITHSFEEAKNNNRRKNIVLLEDGIYITFKVNTENEKNVFGELACWVEDEFIEDESVYQTSVNAVIDLFTYSDEGLNRRILDDDLIESFTRYDNGAKLVPYKQSDE